MNEYGALMQIFLGIMQCFTDMYCINVHITLYTGCHRRNGSNFGRVFLILNYTDITQNTYVLS